MPVKGFEEGIRNRRPLRGGKLRLGEKTLSRGGKEIPKKLDYFRFTPDDPALIADFANLFGEKPTSIRIALHSNDLHEVCPYEYRWWKGGTVHCRGDGEVGSRIGNNGQRLAVRCTCEKLRDPEQGRIDPKQHPCQIEGDLYFLIPDLPTAFLFSLKAHKIALQRLYQCLHAIQDSLDGNIRHKPLRLYLRQEEAPGPEGKVKIYTPHIDLNVSPLEFMRQEEEAAALARPAEEETPEPEAPAEDDRPDPAPEAPPLAPATPAAPNDLHAEIKAAIEQHFQGKEREQHLQTLENFNSDPAKVGNLKGFAAYIQATIQKKGQ